MKTCGNILQLSAPVKRGIQERKKLGVWASCRTIDKTLIRGLAARASMRWNWTHCRP